MPHAPRESIFMIEERLAMKGRFGKKVLVQRFG
jgi:hypothetical protein